MESLPPPRPPVCATQKCKQKICIVLYCIDFLHKHMPLLLHPVCLATFKIQYLIAMSPLLIGTCVKFEHSDTAAIQKSIIPASNIKMNKIFVHSWGEFRWKLLFHFDFACKNVCLSQKRSGRVGFFKLHIRGFNSISCPEFFANSVHFRLYLRPHFTSPLSVHTQQS